MPSSRGGRGANASEVRCSFCGRSRSSVGSMVAGGSGAICNQCVNECQAEIQRHAAGNSKAPDLNTLPTPDELYGWLGDYVVGQHHARKVLAVAVYNHYKRIGHKFQLGQEFGKSNILLIGPTGSGKTLLAQSLARHLQVPFAIADATSLTEAGYVGEDVESIIQRLLQQADQDVSRAQRGIVYIDEIDKIARKSDNPSITRDVSGEGVQQALLKLIEGTTAAVQPQGGRKHPGRETVNIDTKDILFICGGAFDGLGHIIAERVSSGGIGFTAATPGTGADPMHDAAELLAQAEPDDLVRFGLIPELVGRLPVVAPLQELSAADLERVFHEPKDSLHHQYVELFGLEGVELVFRPAAVKAMARLARERGLGARGLRSILERCLLDASFAVPAQARDEGGGTLVVEARHVLQGTSPTLTHHRPARRQANG